MAGARSKYRPKIIAVYAITHGPSGRVYVGGTTDIRRRWDYHRFALSKNRHENGPLQAAFNQDGLEGLDFQVIEPATSDTLLSVEQRWIDHYRTLGTILNLAPIAGTTQGVRMSDAVKAAISIRGRGRRLSEGAKAKISAGNMGNPGRPSFGRERRSLTAEQAADVRERLANGAYVAQIARDTGIAPHTVGRVASGKTYQEVAPELVENLRDNRSDGRIVGMNKRFKITADEALEIRRRADSGERQECIAADFGISRALVSHIKQRRAWH